MEEILDEWLEMYTIGFYISVIMNALVCGLITYAIGKSKNINGWAWGFFLGIIGIIVVALMEKREIINTEYNNINDARIYSNLKYEQLEKLSKLKESNALTDEEFNAEKNKILQEEHYNELNEEKVEETVEYEETTIYKIFKIVSIVLCCILIVFYVYFKYNF